MRADTLRLPAPAKINLFLHINGRRADGYHDIQTAFQFLDLTDDVVVQARPSRDIVLKIRADGFSVPGGLDNLALKAALCLKDVAKVPHGAHITLKKVIPVGSGLGGGSSDAATVLLALNYLWETRFTITQLAQLGASLGADVPVFIHGRSSWAEGIGDVLTPAQFPEKDYLLLVPACRVSTVAMYQHKELQRTTPRITLVDFLRDSSQVRNDFAPLVCACYPEVGALFEKARLARIKIALTGSGAAVILPKDDAVGGLTGEILKGCLRYFVKSSNRSALWRRLLQAGIYA